MKTQNRFFALLTVLSLMMLLVPAAASADSGTYRQFCMGSNRVTKRSTAVYDENFNPTGMTLPANTYLSCSWIGSDENAVIWHKAKYMLSDGTTGTGYVKDSDTGSTYINIKNSSGQIVSVKKYQYDNDWVYGNDVPAGQSYDVGGYYLDGQYYVDGEPVADSTASIATGSSTVGPSKLDATPQPVNDPNKDTFGKVTSDWKGQMGNASSKDNANGVVTLKELGTHTSKVSYQGTTMEVPTAELNFGVDVPEDKKLAVIYTPKTGKASLRKSASDNADMLKQCKAGSLVIVLEYGKTFSLINYKNTVGYILTDCLKFHGVAPEPDGKGVLSHNGKATGGTTVNIRLEADSGSRKIGEFRTGTEVMVIKRSEEWCEIEVSGFRGFVLNRYITFY